jgi:myo-inositol-1(or 4)-monophosphatase
VEWKKFELKLTKAAIIAAEVGGAILRKSFGKKLKVGEKAGAGLVTNIDLASERAAMRILKKGFPEFSFLTEETGTKGSEGSPGRWILDPLDGTTNYVHGFPMFCVSIAAEWEGRIVVGVIYHPILKDLYVAVRGKGATLNGKKMRVSSTKRLADSLLSTGFTYRKEEWLHQEMEAFERLSAIVRAVRRPGSAALDLAYTARGVFDGFWERRLSPWDVAAGALLVQEAGGKVTDFKGNDFRVDSKELLASNPFLHPPLLQAVAPEYCLIQPAANTQKSP